MTLGTDTRDLTETIAAVDLAVEGEDYPDLEEALICWAMIEEAARNVSRIRDELAKKLADEMIDKRVTVDGLGTFEKHGKRDRKKWDRDALLRDVLDTRIVDPNTGEVMDATPLDKVLHVWNLGTPRLTALRDRGLDPEDYCESEFAGFTIQLLKAS